MAKFLEARAGKSVIAFWRRVGHKAGSTQPIRVRVATVDLNTLRVTVMPGEVLSEVENIEIKYEVDTHQLLNANAKAAESALKATEGLRELHPNFDLSQLLKNDPDAIWHGLMLVEKGLKSAGHERPKKIYIKKIPDTKTGDLLKN